MRVFVGQQTASISTSQLDSDNIKDLASRAVAMAKLAPEDLYVKLAVLINWHNIYRRLIFLMRATQMPIACGNVPARLKASALSVDGITNSDGGNAGHGVVDVLIATSNGFSAGYQRSSHGVPRLSLPKKWPDGTRL
ncbi:MAG: hypothetical protein CM15mP46_3820 [Alphaproteobacteria bacterium]|nr:MAG: hypothetical protein CM15mP46_3820 [Alphaproteobacteria bacterium]